MKEPDRGEGLKRTPSFFQSLSEEIANHIYANQWNNKDYYPFPVRRKSLFRRARTWLRDVLIRLAARARFAYVRVKSLREMPERLSALLSDLDGLGETYDSFEDERSRKLMVSVLAYRILGRHRVKLPTNTREYWAAFGFAEKKLLKKRSTINSPVLPGPLDYFELEEAGFPLRMHGNIMTIAQLFLFNQYSFQRDACAIRPEPGDVVIDGGACWGDSALSFAHLVGPQGQVHAIEFVPGNLEILEKNLALNPELKNRIEVVERPFWSKSGQSFSYADFGPSTKLEKVRDEERGVVATTIDDFVKERSLSTVDFIKLDVEGAELEILKGAEQTLRKFRPKLAVSVYHQDHDLSLIPRFLRQLNLGYVYYLDHYTIYSNETVLYACGMEQRSSGKRSLGEEAGE